MSDLTAVSTEDLEKKRQSLQAERAGLLVEHRAVAGELRSRAALEKVKEHVEGLTDADKGKLLQTLQASGVASAEKIGKVG